MFHRGGLFAIKVGPEGQLLCLGGGDSDCADKPQLVLCVHAADAQRMIDVGLGDVPAVRSAAEVWPLSPEMTKQAIQGYVDGVGEPSSSGVRIMTHVTLADDEEKKKRMDLGRECFRRHEWAEAAAHFGRVIATPGPAGETLSKALSNRALVYLKLSRSEHFLDPVTAPARMSVLREVISDCNGVLGLFGAAKPTAKVAVKVRCTRIKAWSDANLAHLARIDLRDAAQDRTLPVLTKKTLADIGVSEKLFDDADGAAERAYAALEGEVLSPQHPSRETAMGIFTRLNSADESSAPDRAVSLTWIRKWYSWVTEDGGDHSDCGLPPIANAALAATTGPPGPRGARWLRRGAREKVDYWRITSTAFAALRAWHGGAPEIVVRSSGNGVVGLRNIGNTCFMNSLLQCLNFIQPLVELFTSTLSDAATLSARLNRANPLGTKGEVTLQYALFMQECWRRSGENGAVISPDRFKRVLGQHDPRFAGYGQEDADELFNSIIDKLHEDLNEVPEPKPYTPDVEPVDEDTDASLSAKWWANDALRHRSVIYNMFCGQVRSSHFFCLLFFCLLIYSFVCSIFFCHRSVIYNMFCGQFRVHTQCDNPACGHSSLKFDHFKALHLAIPEPARRVKVTLVRRAPAVPRWVHRAALEAHLAAGERSPLAYVPKRARCTVTLASARPSVRELKAHLARRSGIAAASLLVCRQTDNYAAEPPHLDALLADDDEVQANACLVAFEIAPAVAPAAKARMLRAAALHRWPSSADAGAADAAPGAAPLRVTVQHRRVRYGRSDHWGYPLVVELAQGSTLADLHVAIAQQLRPYVVPEAQARAESAEWARTARGVAQLSRLSSARRLPSGVLPRIVDFLHHGPAGVVRDMQRFYTIAMSRRACFRATTRLQPIALGRSVLLISFVCSILLFPHLFFCLLDILLFCSFVCSSTARCVSRASPRSRRRGGRESSTSSTGAKRARRRCSRKTPPRCTSRVTKSERAASSM